MMVAWWHVEKVQRMVGDVEHAYWFSPGLSETLPHEWVLTGYEQWAGEGANTHKIYDWDFLMGSPPKIPPDVLFEARTRLKDIRAKRWEERNEYA